MNRLPYNTGMMGMSGGLVAADEPTLSVLIWGAAGIAGLLVVGLVLLAARRRFLKWMAEPPQRMDFSLGELEAMQRRGTISLAEFRVLRRSAMGLAGPGERASRADGPEKCESKSSGPLELDDDKGNGPRA